jgi:glycosyltransferase involved in cell wall biosynthesis
MKRSRILAVGMLPPPLGGQALMFQWAINALEADYDVSTINTQLHGNIGESGLFSLRKVVAVLKLFFFNILPLTFRERFDILYYCVSGPSMLGISRDLLFLGILRSRARRTVYHFHGTGGIAFALQCNAIVRAWAQRVLFRPDLVIRPADVTPNDAVLCKAKRAITIYNGIDDPAEMVGEPDPCRRAEQLSFAFIGAVTAEKGIFDLVEIARLLRDNGHRFVLYVVGEGTPEETAKLDDLVRRYDLDAYVKKTGVLAGKRKFQLLSSITVFLFPTYFRAETQPLAVIEAISLGVPVVASDWRGLNTIVDHGVNGYLVPPRDPLAFCRAIEQILSGDNIHLMREAAREIFLERFSMERFAEDLKRAFRSIEQS